MNIDATIIAAVISIATVVVNIILVFYKRFNTLANATEAQAQEIKRLREEIEKNQKLLTAAAKKTKKQMSWNQFFSFADSMVNQIFSDKEWHPDYLVAVDGGGLTVAGLLIEDYRFREEFNKLIKVVVVNIKYEKQVGQDIKGTIRLRKAKKKGTVNFASVKNPLPEFKNNNVLIVDAQINSGATLKFLKEQILANGAREVRTAVAVKRPHSNREIEADFIGGFHKLALPRFHF